MKKTHQLQSETISPAEWAHTGRNDEVEQARNLLLKLEDDALLLNKALSGILDSSPENTLATKLRELDLPNKSLDMLCQWEAPDKGSMDLQNAAMALKKERQGRDDPSDHINYLDL